MQGEVGAGVLQALGLDAFHSLTAFKWEGRPTICLLVSDGSKVLLVRTPMGNWIPPQGEIELSKDLTFMQAALREGFEEVGLSERHLRPVRHTAPILGRCLNPMPFERGVRYPLKEIVIVGISVKGTDWVRLNHENQDHTWVDSCENLMSTIGVTAESRPVKFRATCEAINRFHELGLITWSCGALGGH